MEKLQKNLCVFIHYSNYLYIPEYVKVYITELSNFFNQIILITNRRALKTDFIDSLSNASLLFVENEGYDFGMFYKVFKTINPTDYHQIACINDSNVLFNELRPIFEWSKNQKADFWGVIDSNQKPGFSTHENNYHIQSHFIVFNKRSILKLPAFFGSLNVPDILSEKDPKKLRKLIIDKWEIGLSQFLVNEGLICASYINSHSFLLQYLSGKQTNVSLKLYPELIRSGFPLMKIKVVTKGKWNDIFRTNSHWKNLIRQYGNKKWNIDALIRELNLIKNDSGNQPYKKIKRLILKLIKT